MVLYDYDLSAKEIAKKALEIAAKYCIYTNNNIHMENSPLGDRKNNGWRAYRVIRCECVQVSAEVIYFPFPAPGASWRAP